jgi:hypothetical protein
MATLLLCKLILTTKQVQYTTMIKVETKLLNVNVVYFPFWQLLISSTLLE